MYILQDGLDKITSQQFLSAGGLERPGYFERQT